MSNQYNLPAGTAALLNDHINKCKNLALILDKYSPQAVVAETKNKGPWLQNLVKGSHMDTALSRSAYNRWHAMMSAMNAATFNASLDWRMVIGLGGETVLETDITLHHLYGIPFIPGSALKGLTRAYVTGEIEGYKSNKIEKDNEEVKRIFGSQEHAGTVLFFDAMPLNGEVQFALDIMNPHYPEYYNSLKSNKTTPPTSDQSPNPITFLTVTSTTFTFALAPRNPNDPDHKDHVEKVSAWLQKAIEKYGVGGKTNAGYGYFTISPQQEAEPATSVQSLAEAKKPAPIPYIRPNIPKFTVGQGIPGSVVASTDELRSRVPEAKAFLRYREFPTKDVLIVVKAEEATNWTLGQTRNCLFVSEEERNRCTVLICQPGANKNKEKKR